MCNSCGYILEEVSGDLLKRLFDNLDLHNVIYYDSSVNDYSHAHCYPDSNYPRTIELFKKTGGSIHIMKQTREEIVTKTWYEID